MEAQMGVLNSNVPISCDACPLASYTVYGPTVCGNYSRITNLRKEIRLLAADKTIVRAGDKINLLHTIESGWAFQYRTLSDGRRQILAFLIPGDIISFETLIWNPVALPFAVRSLTPVRLCTFEAGSFKAGLNNTPEQTKKLSDDFSAYMESLYRKVADIGRRTARGRLAQLILELMGRTSLRNLGSSESFPFPSKQEHIADALGLTVVYVNRTLTNLRNESVIDFDRQNMRILKLGVLRRIADEE